MVDAVEPATGVNPQQAANNATEEADKHVPPTATPATPPAPPAPAPDPTDAPDRLRVVEDTLAMLGTTVATLGETMNTLVAKLDGDAPAHKRVPWTHRGGTHHE